MLTILSFALALTFSANASGDEWWRQALRLTGRSEQVRADAIARLRGRPKLDSELRNSLHGAHRFLALDVIATLKRDGLLDDLLDLSRADEDGFVYLTLNALAGNKTRAKLVAAYRERLACPSCEVRLAPTSAAKIAMLDGLTLMSAEISTATRLLLHADSSPEVRATVAHYVQKVPVRGNDGIPAPICDRNDWALPAATWNNLTTEAIKYLTELALPSTARTHWWAGKRNSACVQAYSQLYGHGAQRPIDIRFAFGYKDARPARFVADRYERLALLQVLVKPCEGAIAACGFERSNSDSNLLTKTLLAPDGRVHQIELRITASSIGPDDDENRLNAAQYAQSQASEANFLQGLRAADVVFYNGHSRAGGGPDFEPPRLSTDGHVDYAWYQRTTRGLTRALRALSQASEGPRLLGLFSCISGPKFSAQIQASAPHLGLLTSNSFVYYTEALQGQLVALNALLGMWCAPEFKRALQPFKLKLDGFLSVGRAHHGNDSDYPNGNGKE